MKSFLCTILIFSTQLAYAQNVTEFKVVMAMNKGDSINQRWLARQLHNLKIEMPGAQVEVVCYGSGLQTLIENSCHIKDDINKLVMQGVLFSACENSMAGIGVTKEQLIPTCSTVKAGVAELVLKQAMGWQYVYASR